MNSEKRMFHSPLPADLLEFARKLRRDQTDAENCFGICCAVGALVVGNSADSFPLEPYVLDFLCFEKELAVELDGGQHNEPGNRRYDEKRTAFINRKGIRVIRFWNHEVLADTDVVLQVIWEALHEANSPSPSPPAPLPGGEGRKT